jgi:hypothetical protein
LWLCEGLIEFLVSGVPVKGPAPLDLSPSWRFPQDLVRVQRQVTVKKEDGIPATRLRKLEWYQADAVTITGDVGTLGGMLPYQTSGFIDNGQEKLTEQIDVENDEYKPYHVHVRDLSGFISKQLMVSQAGSVAGLIGMSRVNRYCEDYGHVMVVYAYQHPENNRPVIRFMELQDLESPIYNTIDQNKEFLTKQGQKVGPDTFAPSVDLYLFPCHGK